MSKVRQQKFGGLDVVVSGGTDGQGGGVGPLCVLLHGFGAPGTDLVPLGQLLGRSLGAGSSLRFAFPAAPLSLLPGGDDGDDGDEGGGFFGFGDSRAWWQIDIERYQRMMMTGRMAEVVNDEPPGLLPARTQLLTTLAELQRELAVPPGRLILGGFSQGSMLSLDVALRSELPLAGLILWSSTFLAQSKWRPAMPSRRGLRVLQSHGRRDPLLPFAVATALRDELIAAGLDVSFHEFGGGHEIPPPILQATLEFLRAVTAPWT
jgi:phospholipase/carboxylesterase